MAKRWYVINTYSGYEQKVKANLESRIKSMGMDDKIFQILIPSEEVTETRNGKKRVMNKKFFPGYLLVEMDLDENSWYVVRNTPKVTSFVGVGNKPTPLPEEEVTAILEHIGKRRERRALKTQFDKGDLVKVMEGPFANFSGTVEDINPERERVKVMVTIFGRQTPVELEFHQVEKE
jgi:transcription termination/antitermination protein NusG